MTIKNTLKFGGAMALASLFPTETAAKSKRVVKNDNIDYAHLVAVPEMQNNILMQYNKFDGPRVAMNRDGSIDMLGENGYRANVRFVGQDTYVTIFNGDETIISVLENTQDDVFDKMRTAEGWVDIKPKDAMFINAALGIIPKKGLEYVSK